MPQRRRLARMVCWALHRWDITPADQCRLLGLDTKSSNRVEMLQAGAPLPIRLLERSRLLLGMLIALEALYPENPELRDIWLTSKNRVFDDRRPIDVMLAEGLSGFRSVHKYLVGRLFG